MDFFGAGDVQVSDLGHPFHLWGAGGLDNCQKGVNRWSMLLHPVLPLCFCVLNQCVSGSLSEQLIGGVDIP